MAADFRHVARDPAHQRGAERQWLGTALAIGGAVMLFLGWWGASGAATVAEQLPYIASGSIPGAALVVAGAIVLGRESNQRSARRTDELIAELHALLVEDVPDAPAVPVATAAISDGLVALASSGHFHRADCVLVAGKPGVEAVAVDDIDRRHLVACPVCEPERPAV
jgi:hypothetical protein